MSLHHLCNTIGFVCNQKFWSLVTFLTFQGIVLEELFKHKLEWMEALLLVAMFCGCQICCHRELQMIHWKLGTHGVFFLLIVNIFSKNSFENATLFHWAKHMKEALMVADAVFSEECGCEVTFICRWLVAKSEWHCWSEPSMHWPVLIDNNWWSLSLLQNPHLNFLFEIFRSCLFWPHSQSKNDGFFKHTIIFDACKSRNQWWMNHAEFNTPQTQPSLIKLLSLSKLPWLFDPAEVLWFVLLC